MVALKLENSRADTTSMSSKQERRGGIETNGLSCMRSSPTGEAGTPWWH